MKKYSWQKDCPVNLSDLAYLEIAHWGYDGQIHRGELVAHHKLAEQLRDIFHELFEARFPIQKMRLIDHYLGSDDRSMQDNNTSAFNCRFIKGRPGAFSKHSWGMAIDINPVANPYVLKDKVFPPAGKMFCDRSVPTIGMIEKDGPVYRAFKKRGWSWGGDWKHSKDYQHFEKTPR